jgi:hypothetical protein
LLLQLETPNAYSVIQNLEPTDLEEFASLMNRVTDQSGRENIGVLNTIKSYLAARGLVVVYFRDKSNEKEDAISSALSMNDENQIEFAKSAAAEASLSEFRPIHPHINRY